MFGAPFSAIIHVSCHVKSYWKFNYISKKTYFPFSIIQRLFSDVLRLFKTHSDAQNDWLFSAWTLLNFQRDDEDIKSIEHENWITLNHSAEQQQFYIERGNFEWVS